MAATTIVQAIVLPVSAAVIFTGNGANIAARTSLWMAAQDLPPGGADLRGGQDEARNAEVAALKRVFYNGDEHPTVSGRANMRMQQGFLADVAIARWKSQPFLPHQQVLLNIFQPEYTHMFESVIAAPQPDGERYYMHLHLPGGLENLANPQYALPNASAAAGATSLAPLQGTLMRVVSFRRLSDARLRIVVQGLGRAVCVRGTQTLPFARGDVQLLPDAEALLDAARTSRGWLLQAMGAKDAAVASLATDAPQVDAAMASTEQAIELNALDWSMEKGRQLRKHTMLAAAAAEEAWWMGYEHAPYELRDDSVPPPAFSSFDPAQAARSTAGAAAAVCEAVQAVVQEAVVSEEASAQEALALEGEASDEVASALFEAVVMTPFDEEHDVAVEEAAEAAASLHGLELQVWLELDELLRGIARLAGDPDAMPAPVQLLGLIPPPPQGGWPGDFALQRVATQLREAEAARAAHRAKMLVIGGSASDVLGYPMAESDEAAEPFQQADAHYPARRRAQRLSFGIWQVIANYWKGLELQPVLEVESTSDRLRMSRMRLVALTEQLKGMGAF